MLKSSPPVHWMSLQIVAMNCACAGALTPIAHASTAMALAACRAILLMELPRLRVFLLPRARGGGGAIMRRPSGSSNDPTPANEGCPLARARPDLGSPPAQDGVDALDQVALVLPDRRVLHRDDLEAVLRRQTLEVAIRVRVAQA